MHVHMILSVILTQTPCGSETSNNITKMGLIWGGGGENQDMHKVVMLVGQS